MRAPSSRTRRKVANRAELTGGLAAPSNARQVVGGNLQPSRHGRAGETPVSLKEPQWILLKQLAALSMTGQRRR